jgi:autotransporter-associated beta strand protein
VLLQCDVSPLDFKDSAGVLTIRANGNSYERNFHVNGGGTAVATGDNRPKPGK